VKLVHLVRFITKRFVTMQHGYMNVKLQKQFVKTAAKFYVTLFDLSWIFQFHTLDIKWEVKPGSSKTEYRIRKLNFSYVKHNCDNLREIHDNLREIQSLFSCKLVSSMNYGCIKSYLYISLPFSATLFPSKLVSSGAHKSSCRFTVGNH
jgi:hypothetical protein